MPPFSTDDYHKLLQKIAVQETTIQQLEVNVEVNGQYGNETTLLMTQISGQEQANRQLISTTKKQEAGGYGSKSISSPPWNSLGAKPKHKSCTDKSLPSDIGRQLTGRNQHPETRDETGWPALPSHRRVSSTPVPRRKQPWSGVGVFNQFFSNIKTFFPVVSFYFFFHLLSQLFFCIFP